MWKKDGPMEGSAWEMDEEVEKPPPTLRAVLCRGLVENSALICLVSFLQGRQVRLSMCVKQQIEQGEGHMKVGAEPGESERASRR